MTRPALALTALLVVLSPAMATPSPRTELFPLGKGLPPESAKPLPPEVQQLVSATERDDEFLVTERTEVTLDGRPCRYADVPANASIVKMELAGDNRTVRAVHFRTKK
jgi:hypothetical protein